MKNDNIYIDKDDLHDAITEYYELDDKSVSEGKGKIQITERLGVMIYDIGRFLMNSNRFRGYVERDDMLNNIYYKLVEIIHYHKFNLFGDRKQPSTEEKVLHGYKLPDIQLNSNQKFCMLDENDTNTLSVFKMSSGFLVDNSYFNTPKDIAEAHTLNISSNKLNALDFGEAVFVEEGSGGVNKKVVKIHMYNEFGEIAYEKDDSHKKSSMLIEDDESFVTIDCCTTTKVDHNMKRFLEMESLYFDANAKFKSIQKNNPFGYLSKSATIEAIKDIKLFNKRRDTLDVYQKDEWTDYMAENPQVGQVRMEDDTYNEWINDV